MKKDIEIPKVEDVAMAVILEKNDVNEPEWSAYIINMKKEDLVGVIIASKGYGRKNGESVKTSVLRHFFEKIEGQSFYKIEMITNDLLSLSNEFWVSFYLEGKMYDKKYIFLADAIQKNNFTQIPIMKKKGILII